MTLNRIALAGAFIAAFTLAACGDDDTDTDDTAQTVEPTVETDEPAMTAEEPAAATEEPAVTADEPADEAAAVAPEADTAAPAATIGAVTVLSLFDVTGVWAEDAAACETDNVVDIQATTLVTPESECDITETQTVDGSLEMTLTCAGATETETWRVDAVGGERPAQAITIASGPDFAETSALTRCE